MPLIDTEVLINWIDGSQRLDTEHDYDEVARYIEECPTVDAVEVVRCRECRYFAVTKDNDLHMEVSGCYRLKKLGEEYPLVARGDGYCSWGERKGGDE